MTPELDRMHREARAIRRRHWRLLGWCLRCHRYGCSHYEAAREAIRYIAEDERLRQIDAVGLARFTHHGYTYGGTP